MSFRGAKVAILSDDRVVALLRDDRPDIPWPGRWDLPGGGREGDETPAETAARETKEETGLILPPLSAGWRFAGVPDVPESANWFFVLRWPGLREADLALGDEGQALCLMPVAAFLASPTAIPSLQDRLRAWLGEAPGRVPG